MYLHYFHHKKSRGVRLFVWVVRSAISSHHTPGQGQRIFDGKWCSLVNLVWRHSLYRTTAARRTVDVTAWEDECGALCSSARGHLLTEKDCFGLSPCSRFASLILRLMSTNMISNAELLLDQEVGQYDFERGTAFRSSQRNSDDVFSANFADSWRNYTRKLYSVSWQISMPQTAYQLRHL